MTDVVVVKLLHLFFGCFLKESVLFPHSSTLGSLKLPVPSVFLPDSVFEFSCNPR